MARKRLIGLTSSTLLLATLVGNMSFAGAESQFKGQVTSSYRSEQGAKPDWAAKAENKGVAHLEQKGYGRDTLKLRGVDRDDLASHARFDQLHGGVEVFGGQVLVHMDDQGVVLSEGGNYFNVAGVNTKPALSDAQALKTARGLLGYKGQFVNSGSKLVILPNENGGGTLAYQVSLHIEDGTNATAHHEYFINAQDGSLAFYYNDLDVVNATGSGRGLYTGSTAVTFGTDYVNGTYYLRDNTRGGMETIDMRSRTSGGYYFTDADNSWGSGTTSSTQSAAVDAHWGSAITWDYYLNTFGRRGIDGNGFKVMSRVHYGRNYNNAFWNGSNMTYGDGDGVQFRPLVSLDVAGHEITHGLTEKTAGLIYSNESGAMNEAMSDIFGTLIEFYSGKNPDYEIGEDIYTPGTAGDALRSMSNPAAYNDPDHYSKRYTGTQDNGGVHINSGIVNQAFYLLANGGTNRTSGMSVAGIGNSKAGAIFYRALTVYLGPSSNFKAGRTATLQSAADLYGAGSVEYNAVAQAWSAVGVQ